MALASVVAGTTLLILHTSLLAGLIWSLRRHGRAVSETAGHSGKLLGAFTLVILASLIRSIRYVNISPATVFETILATGLDAGAAIMVFNFLASTPPKTERRALAGSTTAGNILLATSVACVLFLSDFTPSLVLNLLLHSTTLGLWAWALHNASLAARTVHGTPAWIPTFARVGAYLLVASAYIRIFILNAAFQNDALFGPYRVATAATFLLALLFAWPALSTLAKNLHHRASENSGPGGHPASGGPLHRQKHVATAPTAPPATAPTPTEDTPKP